MHTVDRTGHWNHVGVVLTLFVPKLPILQTGGNWTILVAELFFLESEASVYFVHLLVFMRLFSRKHQKNIIGYTEMTLTDLE